MVTDNSAGRDRFYHPSGGVRRGARVRAACSSPQSPSLGPPRRIIRAYRKLTAGRRSLATVSAKAHSAMFSLA